MTAPLLLIDGNNLIHRSYHALPALSTSTGQPTGAVTGVSRALQAYQAIFGPSHGAFVMDGGITSWRRELCPEYKQARRTEPLAEEFFQQVAVCSDLASAYGFAVVKIPGSEADDVIAVLANRWSPGEVVIVSSDKDFSQLVSETISVYRPLSGKNTQLFTPETVMSYWGVRPAQFVDYLALVGDPSDNLRGCPGIGKQQATALLQKYGTLKAVYENLSALKPGQQRKLEEGREEVMRTKKMVTLWSEQPVEQLDLQIKSNEQALLTLCIELELET